MCRPVSMNDEAAAEWIRIAAAALEGFPLDHVKIGCRTAQRTCADHRKILPIVTAECERLAAEYARVSAMPTASPAERELPRPVFKPTPREVADNERWLNSVGQTQAALRDLGLKIGALEEVDGRVRYTPDNTYRPA